MGTENEGKKVNIYTKYLILLVLFGIGSIVAAIFIIQAHIEYGIDKAVYAEITEQVKIDDGKSDAIKNDESIEPLVKFKELYSINPDIIGWLYACGGSIEGPVTTSVDDVYYLTHRFDGAESGAGTFFIDRLCDRPFENSLTVIYGHNRKDGSMFHPLLSYKDYDYYAKNPHLMVQTENAMLKYEVVSAFYADSQEIFDDKGRSEITRINSADNESECEEFVRMLSKKGLYNADLTESQPTAKDRYLMLVTCEYSGDDNRMVVIGRLSDACTVFEE